MLKSFRTYLALIFAIGFVGTALAQSDPSVQQIYDAARTGHLAQAQQMMDQVLRDHPQSGKAHYVAAELYAREGNFPAARQELNSAETLEPGLPFARPESVKALQRELSGASPLRTQPGYSARVHSAFPWGWALAVVAVIALLWAMVRRRTAAAVYNQYPSGVPAPVGGAPGYGPGYGPGYPGYGGPGVGSGIAGGLASGLAVGAGVVAGEELAHHFLDGDRREGNVLPPADPGQVQENGDMGGSDFGVSDGGGSWDDGGSVGGDVGGGGDWT